MAAHEGTPASVAASLASSTSAVDAAAAETTGAQPKKALVVVVRRSSESGLLEKRGEELVPCLEEVDVEAKNGAFAPGQRARAPNTASDDVVAQSTPTPKSGLTDERI